MDATEARVITKEAQWPDSDLSATEAINIEEFQSKYDPSILEITASLRPLLDELIAQASASGKRRIQYEIEGFNISEELSREEKSLILSTKANVAEALNDMMQIDGFSSIISEKLAGGRTIKLSIFW